MELSPPQVPALPHHWSELSMVCKTSLVRQEIEAAWDSYFCIVGSWRKPWGVQPMSAVTIGTMPLPIRTSAHWKGVGHQPHSAHRWVLEADRSRPQQQGQQPQQPRKALTPAVGFSDQQKRGRASSPPQDDSIG